MTLCHNPTCSKSRGPVALLEEHPIDDQVIDYLHAPFGRDQILDLLD